MRCCFPWMMSRRIAPEDAFYTVGSATYQTDEASETEALRQQLSETKARYLELATHCSAEMDTLRHICRMEILALKQSGYDLAAIVESLTAELRGLKALHSNEKAGLLSTQQALVSENDRLASEPTNAQTRDQELVRRNEQMSSELTGVRNELTDALARVQELTNTNAELCRKLEIEKEQRNQVEVLKQSLESKDEIIAEKDSIIASMGTTLAEAQQMVEQLMHDKDKITGEYNALKRTLDPTHAPECPISLAPIKNPRKISCGHVFETSCIYMWLITKSTCPVCRRRIDVQELMAQSLSG
jgi:chromosome segregation ATPase